MLAFLFKNSLIVLLLVFNSGHQTQVRCSGLIEQRDSWQSIRQEQDEDYFRPGVSGVEVLRARGFLAEEHFVETKDGYLLSVIRGRNPLLLKNKNNNNSSSSRAKEPVLFVHGIFNSASQWILNSAQARPSDFSQMNVTSMSLEELNRLLGDHPSATTMPILAMNFGHEVWLLNRRGTLASRFRKSQRDYSPGSGNITQMIMETVAPLFCREPNATHQRQARQLVANLVSDLTPMTFKPYVNFLAAMFNYGHLPANVWRSFDRSFWNYSLDEQAQFDLPATIDYIIERTGQPKVSLIGHSAGGALILMALSLQRQTNLLNKVSKVVLWSPAFNLGHWDAAQSASYMAQTNHGYIGPIPLVFMSQQMEAIAQVICNTQLAQRTICQQMFEQSGGQASSGKQPVPVVALAGYEMPIGFNDMVQLAQWAQERKPRKFDYKDKEKNLQKYGSELPPRYNLTQIQGLDGPIWVHVGRTDSAVSPADAAYTADQLTAPYKVNVIEDDESNFNHNGYFHHINRAQLVNLPSLWQLESSFS